MPERYLGKPLGKYMVEELIGSGGFAWVYRGYDPALEIPVALKVLKPQFAGDPAFEERFRKEASTAARLRHPNIVKIYEVGRDGDAVYFAMDYLPSGLATKLEATPFLAEDFVLKVGIDVARALGFAHREGVVHRDIKVDNILFDVHGNAVVADFGIARAVSGYTQQTGTNMVVGTPQYFAPEQARAKPLDGRADIYSLGVSLYRASTGRLPFEGEDWYEIARAHVEDDPPRPRSVNPAISPAFERLLLRCLAKHPDDRPSTGEQLADELAMVMASPRGAAGAPGPSQTGSFLSPTDTPTLTSGATPSRRMRRRNTRLALVGLGVIAAFAAAVPIAGRFATGADDVRTDSIVPSLPRLVVSAIPPGADSAAAAIPLDPIDSVIATLDSARAPRPARPTTARLQVSSSPDAIISLNGRQAGTGSFRSDTVKPGNYQLRASLPGASDSCPTGAATRSVTLRAGANERVSLPLQPCGSIVIALLNAPPPPGARFEIAGEGVRRTGALPLSGALTLPVGLYELRITADRPCQDYAESGIRIPADGQVRRPVRMLCEPLDETNAPARR